MGSVLLVSLVFCVVLLCVCTFLVPCCAIYPLRFPHKYDVRFVFTPLVCSRVLVLFMLFVFVVHSGDQ